MENCKEITNLALYQRIKSIAQWVGIAPALKDDLAQEVWILCVEYASEKSLDVSRLSNYEIRLRCFEARRKLLSHSKELYTDDLESFVDRNGDIDRQPHHNIISATEYGEEIEDLLRQEDMRKWCANFERLTWVLGNHPTLKLTPAQLDIWNIYRGNPRGRWKTAHARKLGVTRQNISNIARIVRRKVEAAIDLMRLCDGDVKPFFEKYGSELRSRFGIDIIHRIIYPRRGVDVPPMMRRWIEALRQQICDVGIRILVAQIKGLSNGRGDSHQIAIGYHCLESAFLVCVNGIQKDACLNNICATLPERGILSQQKQLACRNLSLLSRNKQLQQMREILQRPDQNISDSLGIGQLFYRNLFYYGAVTATEWERYLASDGSYNFSLFNTNGIILATYVNILDCKYADSTDWQDFNFIRLLLFFKYYPLRITTLTKNSLNTLITLCQKSIHSRDQFVVTQAEKILYELKVLV